MQFAVLTKKVPNCLFVEKRQQEISYYIWYLSNMAAVFQTCLTNCWKTSFESLT